MKLRTKITIFTTVLAVSVVLFTLLSIRGPIVNAFRGELEKKAVSVTRNLADRIANNVLLDEKFQTTKAFSEVLAKEQDVEYIFVTDQEGKLFGHTFKNGSPPDLMTWNPLEGKPMHIQLLATEKGYVRDVAVSVFQGTKAELHLGIREDKLQETLASVRVITVPLIMFVVLLGVLASFIFSRRITEPLNKFVDFTKVLGRGEYGERVNVKYGDEIGYLARNFNRLSMQLKTAREKMEETYTYTHLLQAEKLSSVGQISAGLAHELKNPLTSLKMLFQDFKEQPDMTREDAEVISSEIEKMDNVLKNFMGFVKQKGVTYSDIDLHTMIDHVLSLATYDIERSHIVIYKDLLESLPAVKGDRGLLEQVFLNLIINAVHAMPDGGEIRISGKSDDTYSEIMIWDKGTGIPSELHAKIFDPFFTTKEEGTGLGLSIAYNIINSHGGKLFFHSDKGKGTVFTVRLPRGDKDG